MCRLTLLLLLFLGEVFVTISGNAEDHYCIKVNEHDTCHLCPYSVDDDHCHTLQHFIDNATISSYHDANITLYFMEGTHDMSFRNRVDITYRELKQLNMIGLNVNAKVRAHYSCRNSLSPESDVNCGLYFEGCSREDPILIQIKNLTFVSVSTKLNNARVVIHNSQQLDRTLLNIKYSDVNFTGETRFANSHFFTIFAYDSNITLSDHIIFEDNTAVGGGAMYLQLSNLYIASGSSTLFNNNTALGHGGALYLAASKIYIAPNANVTFANNQAYDKGGAIHFEPGITLNQVLSQDDPHKCFFYPWSDINSYSGISTTISFINNNASSVGDHIYGASVDECETGLDYEIYHTTLKNSLTQSSNTSLVSSDPLRVCICQNNVPQCNKDSTYHMLPKPVYPGERLHMSVAVVGWDYEKAKSIGLVYPSIIIDSETKHSKSNKHNISEGKDCQNVTYHLDLPSSVDLSSFKDGTVKKVSLYLTTVNIDPTDELFKTLNQTCDGLRNDTCLHHAPVIYNFNMNTTCPPGFHRGSQSCECLVKDSPPFSDCYILNYSVYFTWSRTAWASIRDGCVIYAHYCPLNYCSNDSSSQTITLSLPDEASDQCALGRTGRLCGRCDESENFSLAIGSFQCVKCENDNYLALLIIFAAAGVLLIIFISALNLTVTQGMINGLLYYANIIWAYQSAYLPVPLMDSDKYWYLLRVFIAWINLDFGIHMCFAKGFNAAQKTLVQYLFPIYLWSIAGAIVISARYSIKMTKLFGKRAVSILATILLLSSTKLLKLILDSLALTELVEVSLDKSTKPILVWSLDGSYLYFHDLHILVFLTAVFFLFLWLPYTLLLFSMQWMQRKSHLRLLKWVPRLTPFYDAYLAPLKDQHHYWFGVLLVARCVLLVIHNFIAIYNISPRVNYVLLLFTTAILLIYSNYYRVYKSKYVQLSENFFFLLIVMIGAVSLFADNEEKIIIYVVYASIILVLIAFCGLLTWKCVMLAKTCYLKRRKNSRETEHEHDFREPDSESHLIKRSPNNAQYRDSILNTATIELIATDSIN